MFYLLLGVLMFLPAFAIICIPLGISIDLFFALLPILIARKTGSVLMRGARKIRTALAYLIGFAGTSIMIADAFSKKFYWGIWPVVVCALLSLFLVVTTQWFDRNE